MRPSRLGLSERMRSTSDERRHVLPLLLERRPMATRRAPRRLALLKLHTVFQRHNDQARLWFTKVSCRGGRTVNTTNTQTTREITKALTQSGNELLLGLEDQGASHIELAMESIRWGVNEFGSKLCLLSSMGDEALVHLASEASPGIDVVFLDTGYHFAETLGTRDAYASTRPINLIDILPKQTVAQQDESHGAKLHDRDPEQCCALRKVEPMNRALESYGAWITGMRRVDSPTRADIGLIEFDDKRDMVKLNPLALWTDEDLNDYIRDNHVLLNPLRESGFQSIGCEPCTRPTLEGEDPRAGRWSGSNKTECGLHT